MIELETLNNTRRNFSAIVSKLSIKQLNTIPEGFNNNIIWNYGHVVATQQLLCYGLAGKELLLPSSFIDEYRKGTKPTRTYTEEDIKLIKQYSIQMMQQFNVDIQQDIFKEVKEYTTSLPATIKSFKDALTFNIFHEGLHLGYVMSMYHILKSHNGN